MPATTRLAASTLADIARATTPSYDRGKLNAGILHFGVGNFHRAHQAVYLDRLFSTGRDHDWAILGAGVMESDTRTRAALAAQDYLSTVVEQSAETSRARVIGAMTDMLPIGDAVTTISALSDPAIRIVSLTITEGGYFIDAATGRFDAGHPVIAADAAAPDTPRTVFGLIVAGLKQRRASGVPPFTVMCCDNIPHNGTATRNAVTGLANLSDEGLSDWIADRVSFPDSMVDRITPATGDREREMLARDFGIDDAAPVFCEDFSQWVMTDDFPAGRPGLEEVGVQFVPDVTPFEQMKIRLLNGGHALMAYPSGLLDIQFVHEAMEHSLIRAFLRKVVHEEVAPQVPAAPGTDIGAYFAEIERRLANPKIADTIRRLCLDGSNRQPKFVLPSVVDRLDAGGGVEGLALGSALWCRYCYGTSESGARIAPNDPNWDRLTSVAKASRDDPVLWLGMDDIYGATGLQSPFRDTFAKWLRTLWNDGTEATLTRYLQDAA